MTPERIAELRSMPHPSPELVELIDEVMDLGVYRGTYRNVIVKRDAEIVRLRKLVAIHVQFDWHDNQWDGLSAMCRGCGTVDHVNDCGAAKAAHIDKILDGVA